MHKIFVKSARSIIKVLTNNKKIINFLQHDLRPKYIIPSYEIYKSHIFKENIHDFEMQFLASKIFSFELLLTKNLCCVQEKKYPGMIFDLIFLLHQFLAYLNERKKIYTFHSACIRKKRDGILIVGGTETGKTTISLLLYEMGLDMLSNDSTQLIRNKNKIYITGGNDVVKINILNPYLEKKYTEIGKKIRDNLFFEIKSRSAKKLNVKLKYVILPHLNDKNFKVRECSKEKSIIKLFESSSKIIRGAGFLINNFSFPLPSLDTLKLSQERLKFVDSIIKSVEVLECYGSSSEIARLIDGNL